MWEPGFTSDWAQACQRLNFFWSPQDTQVQIADYNGMIVTFFSYFFTIFTAGLTMSVSSVHGPSSGSTIVKVGWLQKRGKLFIIINYFWFSYKCISINLLRHQRVLLLSPFCLKLLVDCDCLGVQWVRFCAVWNKLLAISICYHWFLEDSHLSLKLDGQGQNNILVWNLAGVMWSMLNNPALILKSTF